MKFIRNFLIASLFITQAQAENTSAIWTGYGGNAGHTGYVDVQTDPTKFKFLWSQYSGYLDWPHQITTTDHLIYSAFNVLNKGTAVLALDPATGAKVWGAFLLVPTILMA